jgi:hypothetical protein
MSSGALPLLARLGEAASFPKAVQAYESDSWGYLRRKLAECEAPLRAYKQTLYEAAAGKLLADLKEPFLKPGAVHDHKETFEKLLMLVDFADVSYNLDSPADPASRREAVAAVLKNAKPKTLFDTEKLPPERRGKPWEALVADVSRRLELDGLAAALRRKPVTARRKAMVARRARRNLDEFLSVTRGDAGMRDDITLFVLTRVEAAIAALLRFLAAN